MVIAVIVGAEIAFWVFIAAGLLARYVLGWTRTGAVLLALSPAVDLVILSASVYDLKHGATAGLPHIASAVYLGISAAWGHQMISSADARFARRFAGGPVRAPKPVGGTARAAYEVSQWRRHLLAWSVGVGLLGVGVLLVGDLSRTGVLVQAAALWTIIVIIDTAISFSDIAKYRAQATEAPRHSERRELLV